MSSSQDDKNLYNYDPNDILPLVAAAIFAATLGLHLWQAFRSKSYNYMWAFILGIVLETGGYLCRRLSTQKQDSLMLFVIQQLLVVVAPALLGTSSLFKVITS
ncbi:hypothetical protein BT69DRAFT_1344581 [Atractiella rhizophila]|nr:hypothetical protein BT69DRAFT_1344581 [Atractiella rhizophila]